jgi:hypothetical protein
VTNHALMNDLEALRRSFKSKQGALASRAIAVSLIDDGLSKESLMDHLKGFRTEFRASGDADAEDIVLEVMDFLAGWCSPKMRI